MAGNVVVCSVVYDEGLYSYKAIAFIKSNPKPYSLTNTLLAVALNIKNSSKQKTNRPFSKLGEKLWKK
ncbi:MAG: hypothetical protein NWF01_01685 [Candidatus Bathyarchaeota archaeon]|nr:hypothetical protein [Candidatus Bathyarchaeota archaeon]